MVYFKEADYNFRAKNNPIRFSQAVDCNKHAFWYNTRR